MVYNGGVTEEARSLALNSSLFEQSGFPGALLRWRFCGGRVASVGTPMIPPNGRLTQPMIRHSGSLRAASWDEALDAVAQGFRARDPRAFGMFSCSKTTNELNYVAQKFVRTVIGSNNIDSCNRT